MANNYNCFTNSYIIHIQGRKTTGCYYNPRNIPDTIDNDNIFTFVTPKQEYMSGLRFIEKCYRCVSLKQNINDARGHA